MAFRKLATILGCAAGLTMLSAVEAPASPAVSLETSLFVEHARDSARILEPASRLSPGERVVTILTWHRFDNGGNFTLTNPLPRGLYYQGSADDDEEISVDGGKSWGRLGDLRIGSRLATPEDVTHVRWHIQSPRSSGRIAYSAIVR